MAKKEFNASDYINKEIFFIRRFQEDYHSFGIVKGVIKEVQETTRTQYDTHYYMSKTITELKFIVCDFNKKVYTLNLDDFYLKYEEASDKLRELVIYKSCKLKSEENRYDSIRDERNKKEIGPDYKHGEVKLYEPLLTKKEA
jgi:hypothetical protein